MKALGAAASRATASFRASSVPPPVQHWTAPAPFPANGSRLIDKGADQTGNKMDLMPPYKGLVAAKLPL